MNPKVTFIIPCYKLAHLLTECVDSVLAQTYGDFEVLIMDDCSPDDTPGVAQSFCDPRVKYIRNETNLGHLRNYNKGIGLARGEYIWLISADDYLLQPYVLARYMDVMEAHPEVGYICCAGMEVSNDVKKLAEYTLKANRDTIFKGHAFLRELLYCRNIFAPSVMVRSACYTKLGCFPVDMPYAGDGYIWGLYALYHDVAFLAEPMVAYRIHNLSMTDSILNSKPDICVDDDLAVLWRLHDSIKNAGYVRLAKDCCRAIGYEYARLAMGKRFRFRQISMTLQQCDDSVRRFAKNSSEATWIRARLRISLGDLYFQNGSRTKARQFYISGLHEYRWMAKTWLKLLLLGLGNVGQFIRNTVFQVRSAASY